MRDHVEVRVVLQLIVDEHHVKDVQQLALVLMQTLDLDVEDGARIHVDAVVLLDIIREAQLVAVLDVHELRLALRVVHIDLELLQGRKVRDPLVADLPGDPVCQQRVSVQQEAALGDAVGLVVELLRVHLVEVSQRLGLQDFRVDLRDAVDGEACAACHVSHADLAVVDQGHAVDAGLIVRELLLDVQDEAAVDLLDDLVDSRKQSGEELDGPGLQGLLHDGMVRVCAAVGDDAPCLVPLQAFLVQKDAHQFRHSHRRVGVVHLEDRVLRQLVDIVMMLLELLDGGLDGRGDEEVLLLQAQLLAAVVVVVRIQDLSDGAGQVLLLHGSLVIALVEGIQAEGVHGLGIPHAQGVDQAVAVAHDGQVVGDGPDALVAGLVESRTAVLNAGLDVAAETDLAGILVALDLKGVAVLQPLVRDLDLVAVDDLLLEHAVMVADAAAVGRIAQRGQGIHEAGRQTAEAAVAEGRIRLLVLNVRQIISQLGKHLLHHVLLLQGQDRVAQRAAHQEFHGHVVELLDALFLIGPVRRDPVVDDRILYRIRQRLVDLLGRRVLDLLSVKILQIRDDQALQGLLVHRVLGLLHFDLRSGYCSLCGCLFLYFTHLAFYVPPGCLH